MNQSRENGQKALFWRQKVEYFGDTFFFKKSGFVTFLHLSKSNFMQKIKKI